MVNILSHNNILFNTNSTYCSTQIKYNFNLFLKVVDVKTESAEAQLEEKANMDLGPSEPTSTTKEQVSDSLSLSSVDSVEITEETLEKEESVEVPKFSSGSKANVEKEPEKTENDKEVQDKTKFEEKLEKTDMAEDFAVDVQEKDQVEVLVQDDVELVIETKVVEKIGGLVLVELEKRKDITRQTEPSKTDEDETPNELKVTENVEGSDPTDGDDAFNTSESSGLPQVEVISPTVSYKLDAPILHPTFSNTSEKHNEPSSPCVSQEVSSDNPESEQKEVLESPVEQQAASAEVQPRFTIAPAWQRSLASGVGRDQLHIISPSTEVAPQTTELLAPSKEERSFSKPARTQSSPARIHSSPMRKETPLEEDSTPDNPFGVRLRRTAVIRRYDMDGDSSPTRRSQTEAERLEAVETPDMEQNESKTITPKKPDLLDTVMSVRKVQGNSSPKKQKHNNKYLLFKGICV